MNHLEHCSDATESTKEIVYFPSEVNRKTLINPTVVRIYVVSLDTNIINFLIANVVAETEIFK
jgi:hypothetical protein